MIGDNFTAWQKVQKILLQAHSVLPIVTGVEPKPNNGDAGYQDWINKDSRALAQLGVNIELSLMADLPIESSNELWAAILARFDTSDPLARSLALSELQSKKMNGDRPIKNQIAELRKLKTAFLTSGGTLTDIEWHNIIIQSLTGVWSQLAVLGNSITAPEKLLNTIQNEEKRKIQNHEMKPFNSEDTPCSTGTDYESALLTDTRSIPGTKMKLIRVCDNCEQPGHSNSRCYARGGGREHEAPDWYLEKSRKKNLNAKTESATLATITRHEAYLTTVPLATPTTNQPWIIDSAATAHMTKDRSLFTTFRPLAPLSINTASVSSHLDAVGSGTIKFDVVHEGNTTSITLNNVLYCPNLTANLLSLRKVIDAGTTLKFSPDSCHFSRNGSTFANARTLGNLYTLEPVYSANPNEHNNFIPVLPKKSFIQHQTFNTSNKHASPISTVNRFAILSDGNAR